MMRTGVRSVVVSLLAAVAVAFVLAAAPDRWQGRSTSDAGRAAIEATDPGDHAAVTPAMSGRRAAIAASSEGRRVAVVEALAVLALALVLAGVVDRRRWRIRQLQAETTRSRFVGVVSPSRAPPFALAH